MKLRKLTLIVQQNPDGLLARFWTISDKDLITDLKHCCPILQLKEKEGWTVKSIAKKETKAQGYLWITLNLVKDEVSCTTV